MNPLIVSFLAFGVLFGLMTWSNRHLFSEGSVPRAQGSERGPMDGLAMWVAISCFLWPILMFTGLCSLVLRSSRARSARTDGRR